MLGRPPWRRFLAITPVAVIATLAMAIPASGAAASAHGSEPLHPYQVGHFHAVGSHWNLRVESRSLHGNYDVRHADPLNRDPRAGYRYVFVRVSGKLLSHGVGGLGYDEQFRLQVGASMYAPAHVVLRHGLPQTGIVNHGQVVMAKVPFLVELSQLHQPMVLRAVSQLDWRSAPRFFSTTH